MIIRSLLLLFFRPIDNSADRRVVKLQMIGNFHLAVAVRATSYEVKRLDSDYFEES